MSGPCRSIVRRKNTMRMRKYYTYVLRFVNRRTWLMPEPIVRGLINTQQTSPSRGVVVGVDEEGENGSDRSGEIDDYIYMR